MIVLYLAWPKETRGANLVGIRFSQVDFLGALMLLASTVLLTFSLQEAGARVYKWSSSVIVIMLTLAGLTFAALLLQQWFIGRSARYSSVAGMFPWRILSDRVLLVAMLASFLTGFGALLVVVQYVLCTCLPRPFLFLLFMYHF